MALRSIRGGWWLRVWVQVRCDGAFGGSRMVVRGDSATTCEKDAAKVCGRPCSRAANSRSTEAGPYAARQCDEQTSNLTQAGNCSVCGSSRRYVGRGGVKRHPRSTLFGAINSETLRRGSWPSKKQSLDTSSPARTRDARNLGSCTKLRMPCLRSCQTFPVWHQHNTPRLKSSLL